MGITVIVRRVLFYYKLVLCLGVIDRLRLRISPWLLIISLALLVTLIYGLVLMITLLHGGHWISSCIIGVSVAALQGLDNILLSLLFGFALGKFSLKLSHSPFLGLLNRV